MTLKTSNLGKMWGWDLRVCGQDPRAPGQREGGRDPSGAGGDHRPGLAVVTWRHVVRTRGQAQGASSGSCCCSVGQTRSARQVRVNAAGRHCGYPWHAGSRRGAPTTPCECTVGPRSRLCGRHPQGEPRTAQRPLGEAEAENPRHVRSLGLPYTRPPSAWLRTTKTYFPHSSGGQKSAIRKHWAEGQASGVGGSVWRPRGEPIQASRISGGSQQALVLPGS